MTNDELIKHRLHELEEFATGWREAERRVDTLVMSVAAVEKTMTQIQTAMEKNDERITASLSRLHERLEKAVAESAREEGREEGRAEAGAKTWKVVTWSVMATISFGLLVVALLNLVTN